MLKNSLKNLDPNPDADDFQNLTRSSLSKDIFLVKFSWRSDHYFLR